LRISFNTKRLVVSPIKDTGSIKPVIILEILTPKATAQLPNSWQAINTEEAARAWLKERLLEGQVYKVSTKESLSIIGFLFLYEMKVTEGREVRIGYLISEQFWHQGLASELIGGLIEKSAQESVTQLIGGVTKSNLASIKVLTKNRFTLDSYEGETEFYIYYF